MIEHISLFFRKNQLWLLLVASSISAHVAALLCLKDLPISYTTPAGTRYLQTSILNEQEIKAKKILQQKRQEDIEQLLQQIGSAEATDSLQEIVRPSQEINDVYEKFPNSLAKNESLPQEYIPQIPKTPHLSNTNIPLESLSTPEKEHLEIPSIAEDLCDLDASLDNMISQLPLQDSVETPFETLFLEKLPTSKRNSTDVHNVPQEQAVSTETSQNFYKLSNGSSSNSLSSSGQISSIESALSSIEDISEEFAEPILEQFLDDHLLQELFQEQLVQSPNEDEDSQIAQSDSFTIHLAYTPIPSRSEFLFKLVLEPKQDVDFKRIRQNVFFLIDRSNSIDKKRYEMSKIAVQQVINDMPEEDHFNILIFDDKITTLSEKPLAITRENRQKALLFLEEQKHGGIFASTELYASLDKIIPQSVHDQEMNVAILLSDGDTFLNRKQQRLTIKRWTEMNKGKVSLFSVASGSGNNLPLLEVISVFNKGWLTYAKEDSELPKALKNLMKTIQCPIVKNIKIRPVLQEKMEKFSLFPRDTYLPHLYADRAFAIYGTCSQPKDFFLFFQGKYYDKWVDLKQKVHFTEEAKINSSADLLLEWTRHQVHFCYDRYLESGDYGYIKTARQLLRPYKIKVAFGD